MGQTASSKVQRSLIGWGSGRDELPLVRYSKCVDSGSRSLGRLLSSTHVLLAPGFWLLTPSQSLSATSAE
jgi:hypothetical protein